MLHSSARKNLPRLCAFAAALLLSATTAAAPLCAQTLTQFTGKGSTAPDGVSQYRAMNRPHVADGIGHTVTFRAKIRSPLGGRKGVFIEDPVSPGSIVVLDRDPAPTIPPSAFRRFDRPSINAAGRVVFSARTSLVNDGLFQTGTLPVTLIGQVPPPGTTGIVETLGPAILTDNQGAVFRVGLFGAASESTLGGLVVLDQAIVRCTGGDMNCYSGSGFGQLIVLKNDPVADRPGRFVCSLPSEFGANDYGVVFRAPTKLDCADPDEVALEGVFRLAYGGGIETVALAGEPALVLNVAGGMSYQKFRGVPQMEFSGIVAFAARVSGAVTQEMIYSCGPASACPGGQAVPIAYEGIDTGAPTPVSLSRFNGVDIANGGDIAFQTVVNQPGYFTGKNRGIGVYIHRNLTGAFVRVAVKGDAAPDTLPATFRRIYLPDFSPFGRLVFRGKVKRAGGPGGLNIYLYD